MAAAGVPNIRVPDLAITQIVQMSRQVMEKDQSYDAAKVLHASMGTVTAHAILSHASLPVRLHHLSGHQKSVSDEHNHPAFSRCVASIKDPDGDMLTVQLDCTY